jgi:hypothetical protein
MLMKLIILWFSWASVELPFINANEFFSQCSKSVRSDNHSSSANLGIDQYCALGQSQYPLLTGRILAKISLFDWATALGGISILVFLCVVFLFLGKSALPSLHESFIQVGILLLIILLICGVNVTCFYWMYSKASCYGQLPAAIIYIVPLVFLLVVVLAYQPIYNWATKYHLQRLRHSSKEPQQSIYELTKSMAHDMEIKTRISLINSNISDISPYVIGTSKECYVVLPSNYDNLLDSACEDGTLKDGLSRLILSHEFAHIKNGDIFLLPIYWVITKPLKWFCLISIVLYFCIKYFMHSSSIVTLFAVNLIPLNITVLCFLYISMKWILKKREQLADAVATLSIHPEIIQRLTFESGTLLAPLETFIFSLVPKSPLNRFCFGYALRKQSVLRKLGLFKKTYLIFVCLM